MKRWFLMGVSLVFLCGCGGRGVYLYYEKEGAARYDLDRPWVLMGNKEAGSRLLEKRLCEGGELREILGQAGLDPFEEEALYDAACGPGASASNFLQLYQGLEREKRNRLRQSFERHGYRLNDYGC